MKNFKKQQKGGSGSGKKEAPTPRNDDDNLPKVIPISDDEEDA